MITGNKLVVFCVILGVVLLAGCSLTHLPIWPAAAPASIDFSISGHWEVIRQINYNSIPATSLQGDLGPAYRLYLVTLAGFYDDTYGITVGPDDDVRYTLDGGQSWTKAASALHCRHGMDIVDKDVAWHCGNGGTRVSTDGGRTWQTVSPSACPYMSFVDAQVGWTASPYVLEATHDGGASWDKVTLPSTVQDISAIALRSTDAGYILDAAGNLFMTGDAGITWASSSLGLNKGERLLVTTNGPRTVLRFFNARNGMAVFDLPDRTVWFAVTSDGGQTWQRAEILALRDRSYYYLLYLSRDGSLLTATDDFDHGANVSLVLKYHGP
jgi:BNR/Asp-box repeat